MKIMKRRTVHDFFPSENQAQEEHDKVFRVYFWKPPAKKNHFETKIWSREIVWKFHTPWWILSTFNPVCTLIFLLPSTVHRSYNNKEGWVVFWQWRICLARLLTSEENERATGSRNILHAFLRLSFIDMKGKRRSLIFHSKGWQERNTYLIILRLLFGWIRLAIGGSISFRYSCNFADSISSIWSAIDVFPIKSFTSCSNPFIFSPSSVTFGRYPTQGETRLCQRMLSM